jgi:hypothetical protein
MDSYKFPDITNGGALATMVTGTWTDIPNLVNTLVAGATYEWEAYLVWRASATTTNIAFGLGGTFTASYLSYRSNIATNSTGGSSSFVCNAKQPSGVSGNAVVTATDLPVIVSGLLVVNAPGTFTIAAKEGAVDATIQAGGRLYMRQTA